MKQATLFRVATQSILKNRMRTLLTMLGIVIGVGAVIVMVAVGQGAQAQIESQIQGLGTNMIVITPGSSAQGGVSQGAGTMNRLTVEDAELLKAQGTTLAAVSPVVVTRTQVIGGAGNWRTQVNGVSTDYLVIRDWPLADGAAFGEDDVRAKRRVVLLAAIASISLVVGGIGIMNIMLVSVTERTREIGVRMAVGARGSDVLAQFLVESIVMSVLGGVIGLAAGIGGAALLGHLTGWATATPMSAVLLAVGFSAAVGVFFGYYPARKAAALNPIQALRYE